MKLRTLETCLWVALVTVVTLLESETLVAQSSDLNALSEIELKELTIHFERTRCYGTCPAYTLTIHGNGLVEYQGNAHVKQMGGAHGRLESSALKNLISEFEKAKFLSISEDYSEANCKCRRCTDMTTVNTELTVRGQTHKVNHYYGCACASKGLFDLEKAIDKAVDSEQWTGDVSKQGPFGTTCFGG